MKNEMTVRYHKETGLAYEIIEWSFFSRFCKVRAVGRYGSYNNNKIYEAPKALFEER